MSSTKEQRLEELAGKLFDDLIVPIAASRRAGGAQPIPLKPDPALATYYVERGPCAVRREDFIAPSCIGFDDFERRLVAYWEAMGRHQLATEAGRFTLLARAAHDRFALGKPAPDVSPYLYAMF